MLPYATSGRTVVAIAVGGLVATAFLLHRRRKRKTLPLSHAATAALLKEVLRERVLLKPGQLGSESDDARLALPAVLGRTRRLLLGDMGHVADVLEADDADEARVRFYRAHPIHSILVCMGSAAAKAISRDLDKRGLAYIGLDGCVDEEGYPLLARHLQEACTFIRGQLAAASCEGDAAAGCCLVHCKEGKNRSACLCVAYLMVEERWPLLEAVRHVFELRPIVLDNASFVRQLIELADAEGLLPTAADVPTA